MLNKAVLLWCLVLAASVTGYKDSCSGEKNIYKPPRPSDRRSPCPVVNALANHGFLRRSGLDISRTELLKGFSKALNFGTDATNLFTDTALSLSTTGKNDTFHLSDLSKHGVFEHDGSLSRADFEDGRGDATKFNSTAWNGVAAYFTEPTISLEIAARAREGRIATAARQNPLFNLTEAGNNASIAETSLYLLIFGVGTDGNAPTAWVRTVFEEERLPYEKGWRRSEELLTPANVTTVIGKLMAASNK